MIKKVFVTKDDNAKGTSWHIQLRQRGLDKDLAARQDNFILVQGTPDNYIVIDGNRYYINYKNAISFSGTHLIDIDELLTGTAYPFNEQYKKDGTIIFADEAEARETAQEQFDVRQALPMFSVTREWDPENGIDGFNVKIS
ncbi:hypothetical protein EQG49_02240 [Periweissella cryptocerci]|uniref:Uncharacterized protein n=2 Tax=Periweissella cryptocerci TaxID=2506420 RepID=A0A4P6YRV0_9LACO|nr:hypothetical protein EQG49_02240 [Periweissella cryptocerci]